jgi:hypothetical protein
VFPAWRAGRLAGGEGAAMTAVLPDVAAKKKQAEESAEQ